MNYFSVFDISATGMAVEKARLETVANNLANVHVANSPNSEGIYRPKRVISAANEHNSFSHELTAQAEHLALYGTEIIAIEEMDVNPRLEYDPGHPLSNTEGYVEYPNINPASEMVILMESTRAYEANVKAISAARAMANSALEIGKQR